LLNPLRLLSYSHIEWLATLADPRTFSMQSGIEAEAGHIEEAGDIEEDIGDEADGATDGGTGVAGATCSDGPIDLIGGSIASMDVLTGRRVARPGPAGGGRAAPIGGGDLGDVACDEKRG
jgi:hypothetical protein